MFSHHANHIIYAACELDLQFSHDPKNGKLVRQTSFNLSSRVTTDFGLQFKVDTENSTQGR